MRHHPLSSKQGTQRSDESRKSLPQWPCLLSNIAVAVAPLRNLTGDSEQQCLVEGFTDRLLTDLFRHCRGFSFSWLPVERRWRPNLSPPNPSELKYVMSGSIQQGSSRGTLRANIRISDAGSADYLSACRQGGHRVSRPRQRSAQMRISRRPQRRSPEMVPCRARSRPAQCRGTRRSDAYVPAFRQQPLVG
jgi:TolB-like protein